MKTSPVKTKILTVASRLFYEQGYNSTGINQVIEEADIARGSLYNHYPSKTDLLNAYVEDTDEQWFRSLHEFLAPLKSPRDKILGIFDFRMERQLKAAFKGCPFMKISAEVTEADQKVFQLAGQHKDKFKSFLKSLVTQLKSKQELLDGEILVQTLYLLMEGATVTASIYKNKAAMSDAKKIAQKLI